MLLTIGAKVLPCGFLANSSGFRGNITSYCRWMLPVEPFMVSRNRQHPVLCRMWLQPDIRSI